jgi:hypothetical protein
MGGSHERVGQGLQRQAVCVDGGRRERLDGGGGRRSRNARWVPHYNHSHNRTRQFMLLIFQLAF